MKKIICILLVLIMTSGLAACGGAPSDTETSGTANDPGIAAESANSGQTETEYATQQPETEKETDPAAETDAYIPAENHYEDDKASLTLGELSYDEAKKEYILPFELKNKSDSMKLAASVDLITVNGVQTSYKKINNSVEAGETDDGMPISIPAEELTAAGVSSIDELVIKMNLHVTGYHSENYEVLLKFTLNPSGKAFTYPERQMTGKAKVIVDNSDYYVAIADIKKEEDTGDYKVLFVVENNTADNFHMMWETTKVNGIDAEVSYDPDSTFSNYSCLCFVYHGCRKYNIMTVSAEKLKAKGIEKIDDISFTLTLVTGFMTDNARQILSQDVVYEP